MGLDVDRTGSKSGQADVAAGVLALTSGVPQAYAGRPVGALCATLSPAGIP